MVADPGNRQSMADSHTARRPNVEAGAPAEPWLSIIGIGEDGLSSLSPASREALGRAEIVFGGPRHLSLAEAGARGRAWPVPFSVHPVLACRGSKVAVLASGDPFWHGAGGSLVGHLSPGEWIAYPVPSTASLVAARLGWRLEEATTLGLHAKPFEALLPHLSAGARLICLVRDGDAPRPLAQYLSKNGFGSSRLFVLEALGGPRERIRQTSAAGFDLSDIAAPVAVAVVVEGGLGLQRSSGLPDAAFFHDGQITKRPVRALTLSALAPRDGELLWDIGGGSGSISVEWCLSGGRSLCLEPRADRVQSIRANARAFGLTDRLTIIEGRAPEALRDLSAPQAIFVGGGADSALLDTLWQTMRPGTRIVMNAVTLETEMLLADAHRRFGGHLMRIELAEAAPLGRMHGWQPFRPIVQWSAQKGEPR